MRFDVLHSINLTILILITMDRIQGLQAPTGDLHLGEEPHVIQVMASNPHRLFSLWRTEIGRLACSYSSDGGETWVKPYWMTFEGPPTIGGDGGEEGDEGDNSGDGGEGGDNSNDSNNNNARNYQEIKNPR